jgi:hypothetical protein
MLVESGVKTGREYHAIDDSHDRFDEPQSYGIFYSWYAGAESFSAESLEGKKCHEYFGHRGCEGTLWETSLTEVGCDTCDLEHLIRPYGDGKDAESWPASARFCHNCGSDEPYYDYVKCDCGTVNCDACRCGDCGGCHQSAHCHYNTECASCGKHYRSQTCEYCESFSAEGFVYFYTFDEDGFGDHYDTLEEAQAAVAASSKPMEIHERREDIHEPYKMDKRMGAESDLSRRIAATQKSSYSESLLNLIKSGGMSESELTMPHKRMINRDIPEGEPMMFCEGCGERNEGNWESSTHACNSCFDGWMDNFDHSAESKLPPAEKAGITGVASGATMEGLETLLADEDACPVCEGDMDFDEAYRVYPHTLCWDCAGAVQDKRYDHAHSAEGDLEETQEELAEVRTELSKSRTGMSFLRTGLALAGFILLWEHHKWAKEEHDIKENTV